MSSPAPPEAFLSWICETQESTPSVDQHGRVVGRMGLVLSLRAENWRNMGEIESRIEGLRKLDSRGDGLIGFGAAFSMGRDSGPGSLTGRPRQCGLAGR